MNKKTLTRVLLGLIAITTVATVIAYFVIKPDRPWMAFYVACCGGVLVFNFLISLFLVNKNLKIIWLYLKVMTAVSIISTRF